MYFYKLSLFLFFYRQVSFLHTTSYIVLRPTQKGEYLMTTKRKQSLKLALSFKENVRDLEIYNYLTDEVRDKIGISTYIKMLIEQDMKKNK